MENKQAKLNPHDVALSDLKVSQRFYEKADRYEAVCRLTAYIERTRRIEDELLTILEDGDPEPCWETAVRVLWTCPFCGGRVVRRSTQYSADYYECSECGRSATTETTRRGEEPAAHIAWRNRQALRDSLKYT